MVWASNNFMSGRILACPVMELFHPYKKLMEDIWRKPEFFYSFFAPLFFPGSVVNRKPRLKFIECFVTALRLVWPDFRDKYLLHLDLMTGLQRKHFQNVLLILDFFI